MVPSSKTRSILSVFLAFALLALAPLAALAQSAPKPAIVLVHGAWADASSWNGVITQLQKAGYTVYAPPNPLRGTAFDAATIVTFLKSIPGPVVLVGHSYGGAVISAASASAPNIKALVYVDAFVPNGGESLTDMLASSPPPPKDLLNPIPFVTASGAGDADLYFSPKYFSAVFASDLPSTVSAVMVVTQRPLTASAFSEKAPAAEGWKTIPSWYVVGDVDLVIPPAAQLSMAQRAKAHISHVQGGHTSMISHPEAAVAAIIAAATAPVTPK